MNSNFLALGAHLQNREHSHTNQDAALKRDRILKSAASSLSRPTCVKSLAPATSTKITLLQSISTAWTSVSEVSGPNRTTDVKRHNI